MKKIVSVVLAVFTALVCTSVLAFDADTIALYDFKSSHTNAVGEGTLITNLIDSTRFTGENTMNGKDANLTKFSAERPGKYIFEWPARGATPVITDPMSVNFKIGGSGTTQRINFADLGTAVSSNDDWTVEFFFMCPTNSTTFWSPFFNMHCGLLYNPSDASQRDYVGTEQALAIVMPQTSCYTYLKSPSYHPACVQASYMGSGKSFLDGLWHHYACVYKASTKKFTAYFDQNEWSTEVTRLTTNSVLTTSYPLTLGLNGFDGYISCLRVSKVARTPSNFLHASNDSEYIQEKVFHWRLDGTSGENVTTVFNICTVANPFEGQYIGSRDHAAHGVAQVGSGAPTPVYTNAVPSEKLYLRSGDERFMEPNGGGIFSPIKQRTTEEYFLSDTGLKLPANKYHLLEGGSFTVEFFAKFDYEGWSAKTAGTKYPRFTLFCLTYNDKENATLFLSASVYNNTWFLSSSLGQQPASVSSDSSYWADSVIKGGKWHHYAVVYDEDALKVTTYLDGKKIHQNTLSAKFEPYGLHKYRHYLFGCGANNHPMQGCFDEIRMVRRALEPSEFMSWHRSNGGLMMFVR